MILMGLTAQVSDISKLLVLISRMLRTELLCLGSLDHDLVVVSRPELRSTRD